MSTTAIEIDDLPGKIAEALTLVDQGVEVVLTQRHIPRARLLPVSSTSRGPRIPGLNPGGIVISDDFDAPLPEEFWLGSS